MRNIDITINRDTLKITNATDPLFYAGSTDLVRCTIVDANGIAVNLGATSEFYASLDVGFGAASTDLVTVIDDDFNIDGDWTASDPTAGKICFRLSTASTTLIAEMAATRRKQVYLEIWTREPLGDWMLLLHDKIVIQNITSDFTPVATTGVTYLTESDEGYTITAPTEDVKTFDPMTATLSEALDFIATLAGTLKTKGVI